MKKFLITIIFGTRPEAIKFAPIILKLKSCNDLDTRIILTGQHIEMVSQVLELFGIEANQNFELMKEKQSLNYITSQVVNRLQKEFIANRPDLVLVQGDTTSAFAASLSAFYNKIPIGHVEAGLRTKTLHEPFPEEANRRLISQITSLHFAPSKQSITNLKEYKVQGHVYLTGNTVIDAMLHVAKNSKLPDLKGVSWNKNKVILSTIHRRENWGVNLKNIALGILKVLNNHKDVVFLMPLHKNKIIREPLLDLLSDNPRVIMTNPFNYDYLVGVIKKCYLVLTDSGGLQEEAPSLGKPVLVLRNTTERIEAIDSGTAKLVGTDPEKIYSEVSNLLNNEYEYNLMARSINPYGDGKASEKIIYHCKSYLEGRRIEDQLD